MNIKEIDKWLDNEYGVSYTRLEEIHDFLIEQNIKCKDKINNLQQENKQLKDKIDKVIEILKNEDYIEKLPYIDEETSDEKRVDYWFEVAEKLDDKRLKALEILGDKE